MSIKHGSGNARPPTATALAVLISGGLDSAILLGESLRGHQAVHPLYIRQGLYWETVELRHLRRFLRAVCGPSLRPLQVLRLPVADLYGAHWSLTGKDVPAADMPDEAVYLPGRNVLLLAKAMLWCHLYDVATVALGSLASNPFPDATPAFFRGYQKVVNQAVNGRVVIRRPYARLSKTEVMARGRGLPLELTFSCMRPVAGRHCGACNKCAERRHAFAAAGMTDPTDYAQLQPWGERGA
jgi:7-cyano-7-deazaguanine synthase